jgi:putative oxidoreductase
MIEQRTAPYAALFLRLTLGSLFIAHRYWKFALLPGGFERWWSGLEANGYRWFVPTYVVSAEFAGALLLIPGIYTRWVSLYAIPLMIGATHFWAIRKGFYFTAAGCELPVVWAAMLIVQHCSATAPTPSRLQEKHGKVRRLLISKDISSFIGSSSLNYESAPHDKWWHERMVTLYDGFRSPTRSAIH